MLDHAFFVRPLARSSTGSDGGQLGVGRLLKSSSGTLALSLLIRPGSILLTCPLVVTIQIWESTQISFLSITIDFFHVAIITDWAKVHYGVPQY